MAEKKKLWSTMKKVVNTKSKDNPIRAKNAYTKYVMSGGSSDFQTWKKENK